MTVNQALIDSLRDDIVAAAVEYRSAEKAGQFGNPEKARRWLFDLIDDYEAELQSDSDQQPETVPALAKRQAD